MNISSSLRILPQTEVSESDQTYLDPKDLATLVDVFRTLLELERKYGSGIETERPNGSDHHQPSQ